MSLIITAFTTNCPPIWIEHAENLAGAKKTALARLESLKDRAYSATDHSQIDGQESEYDDLAKHIKELKKLGTGHHAVFGPLPDGYNIKIEKES